MKNQGEKVKVKGEWIVRLALQDLQTTTDRLGPLDGPCNCEADGDVNVLYRTQQPTWATRKKTSIKIEPTHPVHYVKPKLSPCKRKSQQQESVIENIDKGADTTDDGDDDDDFVDQPIVTDTVSLTDYENPVEAVISDMQPVTVKADGTDCSPADQPVVENTEADVAEVSQKSSVHGSLLKIESYQQAWPSCCSEATASFEQSISDQEIDEIDEEMEGDFESTDNTYNLTCHEGRDTPVKKASKSFKEVKSSVRPRKRMYQCDKCEVSVSYLESLKMHEEVFHGVVYQGEKADQCEVCEMRFHTRHHLDLHVKVNHDNGVVNNQEKSYRCEMCKRSFETIAGLEEHLNTHKGQMFICSICGQYFSRSYSLKLHKKSVHLGLKSTKISDKMLPKRYFCNFCGHGFKRSQNLEDHIAVKHDRSLLKYSCDQCPERFVRPHSLEYHVNRVHNKKRPYQCKNCKRDFYSKVAMSKHVVMCTKNESEQFACEECGQLFKTSQNLNMHREAMHSKNLLTCECGTVVRWRSSMAKHLRKCRLNPENSDINAKAGLKQNQSKNSFVLNDVNAQLRDTVLHEFTFKSMSNTSNFNDTSGGTSSELGVSETVVEELPADIVADVGHLETIAVKQADGSNVFYMILQK
ncbi:zinc finger protein 286A-like isoform X2 [Dreissena polymorpha]|uniref:zinc finger protein 286A-like isoform X2 n=1 Tax=Dreissena polymorpha TaxID=45954 RepID=UPI002264E695|nr:zinc finger protein 286A-like isoform X2 [Dreissena polymorpha]XP_052248359.1 zinc finger protein 286A-like isoform X2 [Dreissena polymorpha]XP_052248360.1 zinc finger protein 286A-like isoform X2 [Dreissena polymorpha]XP_052248361.1 zinc finger protein 286A-like isoform X2 [Dreissena polymorpha]